MDAIHSNQESSPEEQELQKKFHDGSQPRYQEFSSGEMECFVGTLGEMHNGLRGLSHPKQGLFCTQLNCQMDRL